MLRSRRSFLASLAAAAFLVAASPAAHAGAGENKFRANLAPPSGVVSSAKGRADFRPPRTEFEKGKPKTKPAELKVEVQNVRLPAGTVLNVLVAGTQVGTIRVNQGGSGKFESAVQLAVANGTKVEVVQPAAGQTPAQTILTGTFKPHV